jgi:hypothetical protein
MTLSLLGRRRISLAEAKRGKTLDEMWEEYEAEQEEE